MKVEDVIKKIEELIENPELLVTDEQYQSVLACANNHLHWVVEQNPSANDCSTGEPDEVVGGSKNGVGLILKTAGISDNLRFFITSNRTRIESQRDLYKGEFQYVFDKQLDDLRLLESLCGEFS